MNSGLHLKMLEDLTKHVSNKQREASLVNKYLTGRGSKKLHALVSRLMHTIQSNPLPECDSLETPVENFADFLHTKIKKIRDNLGHFLKHTQQHKDIPILDRFHPMFSHAVLQIIMNMPTKQCKLDPIPASLFKQLVRHIIDDVMAPVNISLTRGDFTEEWKTACIKPLLKKATMELV